LIQSYLSIDDTGFRAPAVTPGQLVIDPSGELCLVTESAPAPSAKWLALQEFEPMRSMEAAPRWKAYALEAGGVALLAEPLVFSVGRPDHEQLWDAMEFLTVVQVRELVGLFPELGSRAQRR
jgi:hypothetical protein